MFALGVGLQKVTLGYDPIQREQKGDDAIYALDPFMHWS